MVRITKDPQVRMTEILDAAEECQISPALHLQDQVFATA